VITFDVVQGTSAWAELRRGIPTASAFDEILTPAKLELSKSADKYAWRLIAEDYLKIPLDNAASSTSITRGHLQEKKAISYYELKRDETDLTPIGFVMRDDRRVGCSPDHFVGKNGLLEIKSPEPTTHVGYLLDEQGIGYRLQVQGQLWLCEREWCDTLSFHPDMPAALVRQHRDEKVIGAIATAVDRFLERKDELKEELQRRHGMFPNLKRPDLRVA
jgi:hypothetical protein